MQDLIRVQLKPSPVSKRTFVQNYTGHNTFTDMFYKGKRKSNLFDEQLDDQIRDQSIQAINKNLLSQYSSQNRHKYKSTNKQKQSLKAIMNVININPDATPAQRKNMTHWERGDLTPALSTKKDVDQDRFLLSGFKTINGAHKNSSKLQLKFNKLRTESFYTQTRFYQNNAESRRQASRVKRNRSEMFRQTIDLASKKINDRNVLSFCKVIMKKKNQNKKVLDLSHNSLTHAGFQKLMEEVVHH